MADSSDNANQGPAIDETPISPSRPDPQRKNSLEQHLKHRPLAKHMRADSLNEKIAHRPSPEALIKEGVLHEDPRSPEEKYQEAIEEEYAKREGGA
ncbi:hypothetical protein N0V85_000868 [Neurospora sp. IMI 360204]|nr:hypothetical protein N0V85_000868 [Neurospora sp. IMI 360204]